MNCGLLQSHILHMFVAKKTDAPTVAFWVSQSAMPTTGSWGSFPQPTNFFQNTTQQRLDFLAQVGNGGELRESKNEGVVAIGDSVVSMFTLWP